MKVLLFTHKNDIDGMGSAILAKLAFSEVDYVLCATFDLQKEIAKYLDSGKIYDYDMIFVTDLWLEEPMFSKIASDEQLTDKFFIFDHHKSSFEHNHVAPFEIILKVSDVNGLCCGTSLFYNFLIDNNYLASFNMDQDFVELTRQHDTWEWKTRYNNEKARDLSILFDALGAHDYINEMYMKMSAEDVDNAFEFDEIESVLIENRKKIIAENVKVYAESLIYKEIMGLKAGITFGNYEFRNELGEYLREKNYDIDFLMVVSLDRKTISYRSIKDGVNVRNVAVAFGGKGHDKAATNPITAEQVESILSILLNK